MYRQIPTTKMTVWYVRTDYVFGVNSHIVGETFPNKSQRWMLIFSSYLVIELFHRRCLNDYFLLVFHFFVIYSGFLISPPSPPHQENQENQRKPMKPNKKPNIRKCTVETK